MRGASFIELAAVFTGLALLITIQLYASGMTSLTFHPLWLDECLTQLLATDPSFSHALSAIRGGVETNPPTLYFFLWPLARVLGGDTVSLRAFSAAAMLLALVGGYAISRPFFGRLPALIGTLALSAHPMVIAQMFEARFYGAWLAAATWFSYSMLIEPRGPSRKKLLVVRCLLAMLLATVHWFGVIALMLIGVMDLLIHRPRRMSDLLRALPLACGMLATLACVPFYLGQRSGLSVPTWMAPMTLRNVAGVGRHILFVPAMITLLVYAGWRAVSKPRMTQPTNPILRRLLPLGSLLIFPILIIAFSLLVQPALLDRYVIVAVAPLGPLVALLAAPFSGRSARWVAGAVSVGLICVGAYEMRGLKYFADIADARSANAVTLTRETIDRGGPLPIVFWQRREQYPAIHIDPTLTDSVAVLDFEGRPDPRLADRSLYERDMNRRVHRFYPRYRLITINELRQMGKFTMVMQSHEEREVAMLLDGFRIARIEPEVYEVTYR